MTTLTVGIPVFNEIDHIEKTFGNLVDLASKIDYAIEVLIVDNFSTDGTRAYLESINNKFVNLHLRIIFNDKNEGFTHSCDTLMKEAVGEYLWIIGGHDLINSGGFASIKSVLDFSPDYVICNARIRDENSNVIINESLWGEIKSHAFSNLKDFFEIMGGPCQAVSCNIYRTSLIKRYTGGQQVTHLWVFIERIMDMLLDNRASLSIRYIDAPLVEMLIETDGWQVQEKFGPFRTALEISELYNIKLNAEPKLIKMAAPFRDKLSVIRIIVIAKAQGLPVDMELLKRLSIAYKGSIQFWVVGIPILLSPQLISRSLIHTRGMFHVFRRIFKIKTY